MGIELEHFTQKDVAGHYQCCVCQEIPDLLPTSKLRVFCINGHIVCHSCIDPARTPSNCYLCKGTLASHYKSQLHPAIERLLKDLQVTCSKKDKGCSWQGKCNDLYNHEAKECEHRTVDCSYAHLGCKFSSSPPLIGSHQFSCPYRQVTCTRKLPWLSLADTACGARFMAKNTANHDSGCCKYFCSYWTSGCRFSGTEKDVKSHEMLYCAPIHAKLAKLEKAINQDLLASEKKRIANEVASKTARYKKRIAQLEGDVKAAKALASVREMQGFVTGVPVLAGLHASTPQTDDLGDVERKFVDISIRHRAIRPRPTHHSDDSSEGSELEARWDADNWTLADWGEVDRTFTNGQFRASEKTRT